MTKRRATGAILSAAALWGCIGLFVRQLERTGLNTMQIVAVRCFWAAVVMTAVLAVRDRSQLRIRWRDCWVFAGTGLLSLALFNYCYFTAMRLTSLAVAAVLLYTAPVFVVLLSALFFHERLTGRKLAALVMTVGGCVLVTGALTAGPSAMQPLGILMGIGSGIGYALYSIFGRVALRRYSSETVTVYTFLFAAAGTLPMARLDTALPALLRWDTTLYGLGIGVVCCVLPYLLYTKGLTAVENGRASMMASLEPVVATLISVLVFGEPLGWIQLGGMGLIAAAILSLNRKERKETREEAV